VKASESTEAGRLPSPELLDAMNVFNEELEKAGMLVAAEGLQPSAKGARISFAGPKPVVTDGPFSETKELVGGFWIIQAASREDAVAWIARAPFRDGEQVEIRPFYEPEDFGAAVLEQAARLGDQGARG